MALTIYTRNATGLAGGGQYRPLLSFLSGMRFTGLLLGSLLIYPVLYFRGAPLRERILGCFVIPLTYMVMATIRATAFFPAGKALYYAFNPVTVGSASLQVGLIALADIGCRLWTRRQRSVSLLRWTHLVAIVVGAVALYVALLWDGGVHWFYVYQEGYKLIFQ